MNTSPYNDGSSPISLNIKNSPVSVRDKNFIINIAMNADPSGDPLRYHFTTLENLIRDAKKVFKMKSEQLSVFSRDGTEIVSDEEIEPGSLYVIAGDKDSVYSTQTSIKYEFQSHVDDEQDTEICFEPQNNHPFVNETNGNENKTTDNTASKNKKDRIIGDYNRMIAFSNLSLDNVLVRSALTAFMTTLPEQRKQLSNYEKLLKLSQNQEYLQFQQHLMNNSMIPNNNNEQIMNCVNEFFLDFIRGDPVDNIKYFITGPPQSGKSVSLYSLTCIVYRKLLISNCCNKFFVCPLNGLASTFDLRTVPSFYSLFIRNTFQAASYVNFGISPFIDTIVNWFNLIPTSLVLPQLPTLPDNIYGINFKEIFSYGDKMFKMIRKASKTTENLNKFLELICEIPYAVARAIGREDVLYIIDHSEYFSVSFIDQGMFPNTVRPVELTSILFEVIKRHSFIVSVQRESKKIEQHLLGYCKFVDTVGICKNYPEKEVHAQYSRTRYDDGRTLVSNVQTTLRTADCGGCPGYLAIFEGLINLVQTYNAYHSQSFSYHVTGIVERSKRMIINREFVRLTRYFTYYTSPQHFTVEQLNSINDSTNINLTIISRDQQTDKQAPPSRDKLSEIREYDTLPNESDGSMKNHSGDDSDQVCMNVEEDTLQSELSGNASPTDYQSESENEVIIGKESGFSKPMGGSLHVSQQNRYRD